MRIEILFGAGKIILAVPAADFITSSKAFPDADISVRFR